MLSDVKLSVLKVPKSLLVSNSIVGTVGAVVSIATTALPEDTSVTSAAAGFADKSTIFDIVNATKPSVSPFNTV